MGDSTAEPDREPARRGTLVCVGRLVRARGAAGELEVELLGTTLMSLGTPLPVYLEKAEGSPPRPYEVEESRRVGARVAIKLKDVDSREDASKLIGESLLVSAELLPDLPEGHYYHYQIVGLDVMEKDGRSLGRVEEIWETGGVDVYVVRDGVSEILLPATDEVIEEVNLDSGRMVVRVPPGLLEE